eukprot:7446267-Pyramimonas_sp.AAC.1
MFVSLSAADGGAGVGLEGYVCVTLRCGRRCGCIHGYNNTLGKQLSNSLSEYDQLRTAPVTMNSDS